MTAHNARLLGGYAFVYGAVPAAWWGLVVWLAGRMGGAW